MDDSRRGRTTLRAGLLPATAALALLACGSPASSGSRATASSAAPEVHAAAQGGSLTGRAQSRSVEVVDEETRSEPVQHRLPAQFLCSRDPVAFDLTRLELGPGTPPGFAGAWNDVRAHSQLPGFVIAYSGTKWGPMITARVGSVIEPAQGLFRFMESLPTSELDVVGLNQRDPFQIHTEHRGREFVVAFGSREQRDAFVISDIIVDGRLDRGCQYLHHVVVTLTIPHRNAAQTFGGTTLGDVLGPMTVDTNQDGKPDAWGVMLTGDTLDNLMFSL